MTKLSDSQLVILGAAAQLDDRNVLPLPGSLRGGAAAKVVGALLARGLITETTTDSLTKADGALNRVWRNDSEGRAILLHITGAGLAAIGIEPEAADSANTGATEAPVEPGPKKGRGREKAAPTSASQRRPAQDPRRHQAGDHDRHAPPPRGRDHRADQRGNRLAVPHHTRSLRRGTEEKARARGCLREGRGWGPDLPGASSLTPDRHQPPPPPPPLVAVAISEHLNCSAILQELGPHGRVSRQGSSGQVEAVEEKLKLQRAALADFGLFAFKCDDIDSLLNRASELISDALEVPLVKVLEHLPGRGEMLMRSGVNWQPGVVGHETFGDDAKSPGGYALRTDQPVVSPDLAVEVRFEIPEVLRLHGVKSMINVIIVGEKAPFGVLEVDAQEPREFSDDDVAFLRLYANLLAAAIERVRAHDELRRSAREQNILARELSHRVRNLLGLVRALASQTSATGRSAEEFRSAFIERLQALSAAEGLVFESDEERADPLALAREVLAAHRQDDSGKIIIEGMSAGLSARQARMFALALHELATNAAKYGALSAAGGKVRLDWKLDTTSEGRSLFSLTWQEADGPKVSAPERQGFGSRLLEDVVAHELGGEARLHYEPHGLLYRLTFPLDGGRR